jgi:hypothetical protein
MIEGSPLNVLDFGATGDGVSDDTVAVQTALTQANSTNKRLYFPQGVYVISSTLTVNNVAKGLYLYGDTTSNYNTPFNSTVKSGSVLSYTGSDTLLQINGNASTVQTLIQNLSFAGNNNALYAIKLNAGWFLTIQNCVFNNFKSAGAAAVYLTRNVGPFVGVTKFLNCNFNDNTKHIWFDKPDTNVLIIDKCHFTTHTIAILSGDGVNTMATRNVNITNCLFDSTSSPYDIYSYGGAQVWNIKDNYFEQNDINVNTPRILLNGGNIYPLNQSITISGNVFSKLLGGSAQSLIFINLANGVTVKSNWTAAPASGADLTNFSVLATNITNYDIDPFSSNAGASPYPVNVNSSTQYAGFSDYVGTKLISGNIKFPATPIASADPNVLDDYEEGTWTPGSAFVTLTINTTSNYRRIGSLVYASFDVTFPVSVDTNFAQILGLPFSTGTGASQTASITYSNYGSQVYLYTILATGGVLYDPSGVELTNTDVSGKRFTGMFIYPSS